MTVTEEPTAPAEAPDEKPAERPEPDEQAVNHAALERAVADLPDIPGRDEFLTLCQLARVYAASSIVPKALRDRPNDVLVVLMTGRDLGIPATAALRKIYVIDGQPSIAPQLKLSLIRKKRLGQVIPHPDNNTLTDRQGAIALGPNGQMLTDEHGEVTGWTDALGPPYWYTWDDAVTAGLVREGCAPTEHTAECLKAAANREVRQTNQYGRANFCKDNWRKNWRRMLWARCSGFCADDYFAEATLGIYDPDELGMMLGDDGELIDANHVELPAGFGAAGGGNGNGNGDAAAQVDADPDVTWKVQLRWHALPEDAHEEFRTRWKQANVPGAPWRFPATKQGLVESLLRGVEQQWKARGAYDPETGPGQFAENVLAPAVAAACRSWAPQAAVAAPEPESAPDTAEAAPEAPAATESTAAAEPDGSGDGTLPLDGGADPTDALLAIPDTIREADDDVQFEWLEAYVKMMRVSEVDVLLRDRYGESTKGSPTERRERLAEQIAVRELGKQHPDHPEPGR